MSTHFLASKYVQSSRPTRRPIATSRGAYGYNIDLAGSHTAHNAGSDAVATALVLAEQARRHAHGGLSWFYEALMPLSGDAQPDDTCPPLVLSPLVSPLRLFRSNPACSALSSLPTPSPHLSSQQFGVLCALGRLTTAGIFSAPVLKQFNLLSRGRR